MLVGQQAALPRVRDHAIEERVRDVAGEQALAVLGEDGGIPDGIVHLEPDEPTEQQVIVELFHQQALAADRVQHLQQLGAQELLRGDRWSAHAGVELGEARRQVPQHAVDETAHRAQRMIRRDALLHRDVAPHRALLVAIVTAHAHLRRCSHAHRSRTLTRTRHPKSGFSAAC